jgi:hypothetical protein
MNVQFGFVCDDVRREDNGKLIFIGAYGSDIVVPELPAVLILTLAVRVEMKGDEAFEIRVKMGETELRKGKGRIRSDADGGRWMLIPSILLDKLTTEGRLDFDIRIGEGDWITACSMPLRLRQQTTAASEPAPPS